ncbi:MAG: HAD family hydrolase [Candidatus Thorarchaeota archaeon]|nr:MAG: HAD family hydrolase [Candidatus Thorarchaeota archaeon]
MTNIDTLIFDIGDTLYHSNTNLVANNLKFLAELGLKGSKEFTEELIACAIKEVGDGWLHDYMLEHNVDEYWEPSREIWVEYDRKFLEILGVEGNLDKLADDLQTKWDEFIAAKRTPLVNGARQTVEELHSREYKLGIASNRFGDPRVLLEREDLKKFFGSIEYTNVPGYKKPSPYMLLKVAIELGSNPRRCAYVGNMVEFDVVSAQSADMMPILVTYCNPEQEDLAPEDAVILGEISNLLDSFQ